MTVPIEEHRRAKKLFIVDGKKLSEISQIIGISVRTLANWSTDEGWVERRIKYRQAQERIEGNMLKIYEGITKKASESLDPQDIQIALTLEETLKKKGGV